MLKKIGKFIGITFLIIVGLIVVKYAVFSVYTPEFGDKDPNPEFITKFEPKKLEKKAVPYEKLPYRSAVLKKIDKDFIYINWVDNWKDEQKEIVKLRISPNTYIWMYEWQSDKVKKVNINKIPINAYINIDDMTNLEKDINIKYLFWEPGINKQNGYL